MMRIVYVNVFLLVSIGLFAQTPCVGGMAGGYPCSNVDLLSFIPKASMGATANLNDVWGWTDPLTGKEYALVCFRRGVSFLDVTDPLNPIYLGVLPEETNIGSSWRDLKVVNDHAFVGSDNAGDHGIQVFDLKNLRNPSPVPQTFSAVTTYKNIGSGSSHNVVGLQESQHLVVVGGRGTGGCGGGLIFLDVSDPANPIRRGEFCDRYVHDAVCFTYRGPDTDHFGKEICVAFNGSNGGANAITVVDATDTDNPTKIGDLDYPIWRYSHQGWVSDDHKFIILNDELDELNDPDVTNTRTYVVDITNLDQPQLVDFYEANFSVIDHNLYVKGQYVYQANYRAGIRMLDIRDLSSAGFSEVAYFDTYPAGDGVGFNSAWSVYPYFESGNLLVSDIEQGLFILKPTFPNFFITSQKIPDIISAGEDLVIDIDLTALAGYSNSVTLSTDQTIPSATLTFGSTTIPPNGSTTLTVSNTENLSGPYHLVIQARGPGDDVIHDYSISFNVIPRIYVDQSVSNSGNGSRWNQAYKTITEALAVAPSSGAEIWVAEGTYYPTDGLDRSLSFEIPDSVRLLGGFAGTETNVAERNIDANLTILSGDIGVNGSNDNSYHVIKTSGIRSSCTIDGFTIQDGNANGVGNSTGGGLLSANFKTRLLNCVFKDNFASQGSAIYNDGAILQMNQCTIAGLDAEMIYNADKRIEVQGDVELIQN